MQAGVPDLVQQTGQGSVCERRDGLVLHGDPVHGQRAARREALEEPTTPGELYEPQVRRDGLAAAVA